MLSTYLDTSVLVPLFIEDVFSPQAQALLRRSRTQTIVGDFAAAEFASALGLRCRRNLLEIAEARAAFEDFDAWRSKVLQVESSPTDIRSAEFILRRLDLTLRAPDAIHIAIAQRIGAELATFDSRLAACAQALGTAVVSM